MLQQDKPEDFVIATGVQHSVREFVVAAAGELGMKIRWEGKGAREVGVVDATRGKKQTTSSPGKVIVRVDPRYLRPTEVETLVGDASKARAKLGWIPKTSFSDLVIEMAEADLAEAQRELANVHGRIKSLY